MARQDSSGSSGSERMATREDANAYPQPKRGEKQAAAWIRLAVAAAARQQRHGSARHGSDG